MGIASVFGKFYETKKALISIVFLFLILIGNIFFYSFVSFRSFVNDTKKHLIDHESRLSSAEDRIIENDATIQNSVTLDSFNANTQKRDDELLEQGICHNSLSAKEGINSSQHSLKLPSLRS